MKPLRGTKTAENLLISFAGESQARNRYQFYAKVAKKEGYEQIAAIFEETAMNEQTHAKRFFSFLTGEFKGEELAIGHAYPVGLGTTSENLQYAADGEYDEWAGMYPAFADTAEAEGFPEIAACFRFISKAETNHEKRFRKLKENVDSQKVFEKDEETEWKCEHCGYIHKGKAAPQKCPACLHPQAYFEVHCENY